MNSLNLRKTILVLFIMFTNILIVKSQMPIYTAPNILPPSPTAAELGKYGLIPVSLATGTPNIDIPLFEFKTKNLTIPISVSYNSNGIKVDEIASWVGIGWSLNCGGVISRIVRDDPDEKGFGTTLPYPEEFNTNDPKTINFITYAGNNQNADFEPDLYTFNFLGYTGKFIIDRNWFNSVPGHLLISCNVRLA